MRMGSIGQLRLRHVREIPEEKVIHQLFALDDISEMSLAHHTTHSRVPEERDELHEDYAHLERHEVEVKEVGHRPNLEEIIINFTYRTVPFLSRILPYLDQSILPYLESPTDQSTLPYLDARGPDAEPVALALRHCVRR